MAMRSSLIIAATLILSLVLAVMPVSAMLELYRPMWLALVLAYWVLVLPHRVGLLTAWISGLACDVLYGQLLGQHALALTLVATMVLLLQNRLRRGPLWQQALILLPVLGISQLVLLWLNSLSGSRPPSLLFMLPVPVSALLWPWVYSILAALRKRYHVH